MPNYGFMADGQHGCVFETTDPVDGEEVFATFSEARTALADWFAYVARAYFARAREARKIRKASVREQMNLSYPDEVY